jgi:Ribonuclease G/E
MLINVAESEECRVAVVEARSLEELYVERASLSSRVGNIYKGKVVNIESGIQAAFVDFGIGRNGQKRLFAYQRPAPAIFSQGRRRRR